MLPARRPKKIDAPKRAKMHHQNIKSLQMPGTVFTFAAYTSIDIQLRCTIANSITMPGKYDKILRENIESIIPFIIEKIVGIDFDKTQVIKDKLQVTIERETDYICLIASNSGHEILHLEFQTGGSKRMPARMLLYKAILLEKFELPIRQFVIYLGKSKKPNIPTSIISDDLVFSYQLINIRDISVKVFLQSNFPEGVILAVLGEFNHLPADEIIQQILIRLQELAPDENRLQKCVVHLRIFSQLRNLQSQTVNQINIMALKIDIRKDPFYEKGKVEGIAEGIEKGIEKGIAEGIEKGIEKGIEEKSRQIVINLLNDTTFDDKKIATLSAVSLDFVQKMRKEIK
jgi:predicted transposase YdaD